MLLEYKGRWFNCNHIHSQVHKRFKNTKFGEIHQQSPAINKSKISKIENLNISSYVLFQFNSEGPLEAIFQSFKKIIKGADDEFTLNNAYILFNQNGPTLFVFSFANPLSLHTP